MDILAIAIHEIANISERRIERLVHPGTIIYIVIRESLLFNVL